MRWMEWLGWLVISASTLVSALSLALFFRLIDRADNSPAVAEAVGMLTAVAITGGLVYVIHMAASSDYRWILLGAAGLVTASEVVMIATLRVAQQNSANSLTTLADGDALEWVIGLFTAWPTPVIAAAAALVMMETRQRRAEAEATELEAEVQRSMAAYSARLEASSEVASGGEVALEDASRIVETELHCDWCGKRWSVASSKRDRSWSGHRGGCPRRPEVTS